MNVEEKKKYKGYEDISEILSKETNNIYRNLFILILARHRISFRDFNYEKEDEEKVKNAINVLLNAGVIASSGTHYYPTSFGLRKARELNISERPKAWF